MAFIDKEACNPTVVPCQVTDIRVPIGAQQAVLYTHFMDRTNIHSKNALVRARQQIAYLRGICADPAGFEHGGPKVASNFNPKTIAALELVADLLGKGEQVVIVSARVGQTDELYRRLCEAFGGRQKLARIDSTVPASEHNAQAMRFKAGHARVLLMGIKCAKAYSFDGCPNLIIVSLEYSYGSLHQAMGRVWRVASTKPVKVFCVLHQNTIEEVMYDIVATKKDAATICLHGQRVPREYAPVSMDEVMAATMVKGVGDGMAEVQCEHQWPELRGRLRATTVVAPWRLRLGRTKA